MKKVSRKSHIVIKGLLDYLSETGEQNLLPEVSESLENVVAKSKGSDKIIIISAVKLTADQLTQIKQTLNQLLKIDLPIVNRIEEKLIGGFTVKINDWFLDASLYHQLQLIKKTLLS